MPFPFHTIWLGGSPPLRVLDNLCHLLCLSAADPAGSLPVLWLDHSAWHNFPQRSPLPLQICPSDQVPAAMAQAFRAVLPSPPNQQHWLRIAHPAGVRFAAVLLVEEHNAALAEPWLQLQPATRALASMARTPAGAQFLEQELGLSDPIAAALLQGPELLAYLGTLLGHTQRHWGRHGLLCLASDLLRLLALAWQPGIYGDLGDVAGRLPLLPGAAEAGPAGFCAHHTMAIENDLILATDRPTLQAITLATALWSWRSVRAIARRLQITESASEPAALLQAVLPHLDERLPPPPSLAPLLQPPWTRLADAINLAYGAAPLFHPPATLAAYSAGRRGKELLINDVGGFTGYQKAAHHLVPGNAACWERCAARLGLDDYAPQLGWKTCGFGAIERLIDGGRRLQDPTTSAAMAAASRADLALLAEAFALSPTQLEPIARLAYQLHQRLSAAHHQPEQRAQHLAQVETLCAGFGPAA
ncbi:MAG: hypothetical protein VKM34_12280 [Cyanobacteriota bacterium]|nr:hypothetical protein [Cyanobacteriota bacterium]